MDVDRIKLVVIIIDRTQISKVLDLCYANDAFLHYILYAKGTARSEMLDILGVGETEKSVILTFIRESHTSKLLRVLDYKLELTRPARGVAFSIPICRVNSVLNRLVKEHETIEKDWSDMERKHGIIITAINHGLVDTVMEVARKAGATGGTVLQGRAIAHPGIEDFLGITFHPEKDIVAIITKKEDELKIMNAIQQEERIKAHDKIVLFSLPVDQLVGLEQLTEDLSE